MLRTIGSKTTADADGLLARMQRGDRAAFEEVMRRYDGVVRAVVSRLWSSPFDREEALQEIWLHVWSRRETVDPSREDEAAGWLATLARRRAIDLLRRRGGGRETNLDDVVVEVAPTQGDELRNEEVLAAVRAFEERLKPEWRAFFRLHFVDGLDYGEISERLSISRLRCKYMKKVLLGRARRSGVLRAALDPEGGTR